MPRYDDDEFEKDEEQFERPSRAKRYEDDDDDAPVPSPKRSKVVNEDDDDAPAQSKGRLRGGWDGVSKLKSTATDASYAQRLKISEEPIIIKFIEDAPYAAYRQHWVERSGQKSFTCIANLEAKGCPLCQSGNRPSSKFAFNVVLLTPDEEPVLRSYEVGSRVIDQLKNFNEDPRQGPLTKHYWAVSRSGKGPTTATNHQLVKARDLVEEWGVEDLDASLLSSFRKSAYTEDIIAIPSFKELMAIVSESD